MQQIGKTKATLNNQKIVYEANLKPLNTGVTGMKAAGKARFVISHDTMTVIINVDNVPPGISHEQHIHGFNVNKTATCPAGSADINGDGIEDIVETEIISGMTMVPFNDHPIKIHGYGSRFPVAGSDSSYHYEVKISMGKLETAFIQAFGHTGLNLEQRVIYIHGVPDSTDLPESVKSIGNLPPQVTLPIACGDIEKVSR